MLHLQKDLFRVESRRKGYPRISTRECGEVFLRSEKDINTRISGNPGNLIRNVELPDRPRLCTCKFKCGGRMSLRRPEEARNTSEPNRASFDNVLAVSEKL